MTVRMGILAFNGCLASGITGPVDVFNITHALAAIRTPSKSRLFSWEICSAQGGAIRASSGICFDTRRFNPKKYDVLMLPGIDHASARELLTRLKGLSKEVACIAAFVETGRTLASSCSAAFLVAKTGRLDGKRATTSWWLAGLFSQANPQVHLLPEEVLVHDGQFLSAGGTTSYFDLSLKLVERFAGADLKQACARLMLMDHNRLSQAPYMTQVLAQEQRGGFIERAEKWMLKRLDQPFSVAALADHCRVSVRTLLRRFQRATGAAPTAYLQKLRIERAKVLLESTHLPWAEIVVRCGYQDVSAFRKLFKGITQLTPKNYRERFALRRA